MKKIAAFFALIFNAGLVGAFEPGMNGAWPDLYAFPGMPSFIYQSINQQTSAVTRLADQSVNTGITNLVLIVAGQSNAANVSPSAYSPVNGSAISQLNVLDGALYTAADPLLGTSTGGAFIGNPGFVLADSLISAGKFARVIVVPIALGATTIADWNNGFLTDHITITMRRIAARGIVAGGNVTFALVWGHGETDCGAGTSQAAYTTGLNGVITKSRTAGFAGRFFVASQSLNLGVTCSNITNAQAAVIDHGLSIWAGPNADLLVSTTCGGLQCRIGDNTHFTNAGAASYAGMWVTAMGLSGAPF